MLRRSLVRESVLPRPVTQDREGRSDPIDVDAVNSLSSQHREKGSSSPRDGCFHVRGHFPTGLQIEHVMVQERGAKERAGRTSETPKEHPKESKESKVRTRVRAR